MGGNCPGGGGGGLSGGELTCYPDLVILNILIGVL